MKKNQEVLAENKIDRPFLKVDRLTAWIAGLVSFAVYVFTLAPNVTLEDSGEFIAAAVHLGVPHPPGYPTWTIFSYLVSNLFPFGNVAWRVNLVSAICGAAAIGYFALLMVHSLRWILTSIQNVSESLAKKIAVMGALVGSGVLAFSDVMWSQSVIAEVYTLNAFFLSLTLLCFYRWVLNPKQENWLVAAALVLALGMTNHHTLLFIFPAFFIGVWFVRRDFFLLFLVAILLTSTSVLAYFCWLSADEQLIQVGKRVGTIAVIASAVAVILCRMLEQFHFSWKFVGKIFIATWLGLSVYAYMPFASKTNPPMNWGYASERQGFYHAINRGQYADNMATTIKRFVAPIVGVPIEGTASEGATLGRLKRVTSLLKVYFLNLANNISWPVVIMPLFVFLFVMRLSNRAPQWLGFTLAAFLFMSALQMFIMNPGFDNQSQWVGKTFLLQSHCIFTIGVAYGVAFALLFLFLKIPKVAPVGYALLALPLLPFFNNYAECEQRDHWFGWMYGTDMLRDMEPQAVVFGGTDPGRFVPTYTIFCESTQNPRWKRDPSFDRSDLALITQNALADGTYMKYIRSHYDVSRRTNYNAFERWLGRHKMYPKDPLIMPTDEEVQLAFQTYLEQAGQESEDGRITVEGIQGVFAINGLISKMIFDKNKETRAFYIEESFPMDWYYPHATPFGLCLKINKEPLAEIPKDIIQKDKAYWDAYTKKLVENPKFRADRPAKMSFSKLRSSIGNVYMYRNLWAEAEYAYKQALEMAPDNAEVVFRLADLYANQSRFQEAQTLAVNLKKLDPNNTQIDGLIENLKTRQQQVGQRAQLEQAVNKSSGAFEPSYNLLTFYLQTGDLPAANRFIDQLMPHANYNAEQWQKFAEAMLGAEQIDAFFKVLKKWELIDPKNPELSYDLGVLYASEEQNKEAIQAFEKAIRYGGEEIRKEILEDERLQEMRELPEFKKMVEQTQPEKK